VRKDAPAFFAFNERMGFRIGDWGLGIADWGFGGDCLYLPRKKILVYVCQAKKKKHSGTACRSQAQNCFGQP
jgi:hypothetical protein